MSFDISAVGAIASASAPDRAGRTASAHTSAQESVHVDTIPASPPPEVHEAMAVADHAYERLAAANRALHFTISPSTGRLSVEVHDMKGNLLFSVPASKALEVAAGGHLE